MPRDEKFTLDDLEAAVNDLESIPFFPRESRATVITHLRKMCPHKRALRWLVDTAVTNCRQWPGIAEIRGLLCSRFDAADGIDQPNCSIPGFSAEDAEARYLARHDELKQIANKPMSREASQMIKQLTAGKGLGQ